MKKWTLKIECTRYSDVLGHDITSSMEFEFFDLNDAVAFVETFEQMGVGKYTYHFDSKEVGEAEC